MHKNIFNDIKMTWPRVICFAVLAAALTAGLKLIPFLDNTSFQNIAVTFECWILFALVIILNCNKLTDAVLKCFVFFLISQPLIYLIQVPFSEMGFGLFQYYKYWFIMTILTIPGSAIAYQVKRQNILSLIILSVANIYLAYMAVGYFKHAMFDFPYQLFAACFCIALAIFFVFNIIENKRFRIVALAIVAVCIVATAVIEFRNTSTTKYIGDENWGYTNHDSNVVSVDFKNGEAVFKAKHDGNCYVEFSQANGEKILYYVTVLGGNVWVDRIE